MIRLREVWLFDLNVSLLQKNVVGGLALPWHLQLLFTLPEACGQEKGVFFGKKDSILVSAKWLWVKTRSGRLNSPCSLFCFIFSGQPRSPGFYHSQIEK